jgi:hypothetical protein
MQQLVVMNYLFFSLPLLAIPWVAGPIIVIIAATRISIGILSDFITISDSITDIKAVQR